MKRGRLALLCLVVFVAVGAYFVHRAGQQPPWPVDSVGLWTVAKSQVQELNARAEAEGRPVIYRAPDPFGVDVGTVTIQIFFTFPMVPQSDDNYYRLKAKWVGRDLYWFSPVDDQGWRKLATFQAGRFILKEGDIVWRYERTAPDQLPGYARPLLKKRQPLDYSIDMYW